MNTIPKKSTNTSTGKLSTNAATGLLNPTLKIEVAFVNSIPGRKQPDVSKFDLAQVPGITPWLIDLVGSFMSCDDKATWAPPMGALNNPQAIRTLVNAKVLFEQANDAIALPSLGIRPGTVFMLLVTSRRNASPLLISQLSLFEAPRVAYCVLSLYNNELSADDIGRSQTTDTITTLQSLGVLVDELPSSEVFFSDPGDIYSPPLDFGYASTSHYQTTGQPPSEFITGKLGKFSPRLANNADFVWYEDAGTGILCPACADKSSDSKSELNAGQAALRKSEWDDKFSTATDHLSTNAYAKLHKLIPDAQQKLLQKYVRGLLSGGYFPELGTPLVALRTGLHSEPTIASLHQGLAAVVSRIVGAPHKPSYSFLACYEAGAVLKRHIDRPQCVYNLSLVLDMSDTTGGPEPEPWPFFLEKHQGPQKVSLNIGDGLLYQGDQAHHWRDALPENQRAIICFYHFVPEEYSGSID